MLTARRRSGGSGQAAFVHDLGTNETARKRMIIGDRAIILDGVTVFMEQRRPDMAPREPDGVRAAVRQNRVARVSVAPSDARATAP
jgi:hypothetical protein